MADRAAEIITDISQYRALINRLADQLCPAIEEQFDFAVRLDARDEAIEKLQVLINVVLDAARRSIGQLQDQKGALTKEIEDRKRLEAELRASEERFMAVLYASRDAMLLISEDTFVDCNEATARMLGYASREEVLMKHPSELSPPKQPDGRSSFEKANEMIALALKEGFHRFEWMHRRANGEPFPVEVSLTPLSLRGQTVIHCVWRDISDRKKAAADRERVARVQLVLNRLQQELLGPGPLTDKLDRITASAVRLFDLDFCRIWMTKPGDLCESGCVHAGVTEGPQACTNRSQCLHLMASSGRYAQIDEKEQCRVPFGCHEIGRVASRTNGHFLTNEVGSDPWIHNHEWAEELGLVSFVGYPLRPPGGETLGVLAGFSKQAITPEIDLIMESLAHTAARIIQSARVEEEQQQLQNRLNQAQRLESVGQLAAGIAHEINTPTQFVNDNTRFLRNAFPKLADLLTRYRQLAEACRTGPVPREMLDDLDAAAKSAKLDYLLGQIPEALSDSLDGLERVTKIVRAMKDFAHPGQQSLSPADLNKAIESTVTVARNEWKYVADMQLDLDPELPPVPCLLSDFNQVVLNIVVNAAHAIKDAIGENGQSKGTITISTRRDGDHVEVRIRDTGTGIPEAYRAKVYDHFFTTKAVGKGTGQGLAIARSVIVEKHRGTLTFETEMGKGTTFIIRLPLEQPEQAPPETPKDALACAIG